MPIYKVYLDMTEVIASLKPYKLGKYNAIFPIVFVEARNPDDACFRAIYNLVKLLLSQDDSVKTRLLCRKIRRKVRIMKAECQ
jgi:hypothetical protein